jgi:hypothetical protein
MSGADSHMNFIPDYSASLPASSYHRAQCTLILELCPDSELQTYFYCFSFLVIVVFELSHVHLMHFLSYFSHTTKIFLQ